MFHLAVLPFFSHGTCEEDIGAQSYDESGDLTWPAWHIWPQIFYNEKMTQYEICSAEQPTCADKFPFYKFSIADHTTYFGISAPKSC